MRAIQTRLVAVEVGDDEQSVFWMRKEDKGAPLGQGIRMGQAQMVTPPLTVKAGTSAQFDALLPRPIWSSGQWRLVVLVEVESGGISAWKKRLGLCWRGKTLGPLLNGWTLFDTALLRTEPITNAAPSTADAARP